MADTLSEALLVLTSWNTASDDLTSQPTRTLVKDFCENTLKSDEVSKLYCTVLDVEVSEDQKKDAESVGVTLIPATRSKWADPDEDPPGVHWLFSHSTHYQQLKDLQNVKLVVSFSPKTKNAAAAIHESLFPQAQLHQHSAPDLPASALLVHTNWHKDPESTVALTTQLIIEDIKENTLNSEIIDKLYCTVFDTEISKDQKRNAESIGVTLMPAKKINSGAIKDPPGETWLVHHESRYPTLRNLQNIKHVISFSSRTRDAATFVHQNFFLTAKLHHVTPPGVLFAFDVWDKNGCGLSGYHRTVILDFCARKIKAGEPLKAYSTVLATELTDEQIEDADKCHVTLIHAQRKSGVHEYPKIEWLLNHESYYPDLSKLDNIKYVVGYAPKTGQAAIDIGKRVFPEAKLVLINHACQEPNCLIENNDNDSKEPTLENEMLKMASEADILLSVGPLIHQYFENAYKANYNGKELSDIPHVEIFPKPRAIFIDSVNKKTVNTYSLLTYGQFSEQKAWKQCKALATHIGTAGRNLQMLDEKPFEWKLHGISKQAIKVEGKSLKEKMKRSHVNLKLSSTTSAPTLLQSIQQSNLCLPPPCYTDYSFEGLEAMAAGLPTTVQHDSHIAYMIRKYLNKWKEYCLLKPGDTMPKKIVKRLRQSNTAFQQAEELKVALIESRVFTEMLGEFTSLFTERGKSTTGKTDETGSLREAEQGNNGEGSREMKCKMGRTGNANAQINQHKPPSSNNIDKGEVKDSDVFTIKVKLVEESYQDKIKQLDGQEQTGSVLEQKKTLHAAWEKFKEEVHKNADTMISAEDARSILTLSVNKHFGEGTLPIDWETGCLKISLNIPNQYHLYRVKHSCRSGSFPDSFEPLLITDKMREEAYKVGLQLKLKATYDQARFDKLRLFFINRDGGGLEPVKVYDDVIEGKDAEEIHIDGEDTDQKSNTSVIEGVADRTPTEDRQCLEDIQTKHGMERTTLESQLKEAKEEKATLEERCKELTQKLERSEQSLVSQRIENSREREKLQSELKDNQKLVNELQNTVVELQHNLEQSSLKKPAEKAPISLPQRPPQHHHEMSAGHMMQASAATGPPTSPVVYSQALQVPYQTAQSHTQGTTKDEMRLQRIQLQDQPNIQHTQKPIKDRSSPQGLLTSPHHQRKNPIPQEIQISATQLSDDWSVTLVSGQHQGRGQKFKLPCGLAFHRDKLVVCDSGNNIVQILNKDYTCDKVIGSFNGQFAKPFRPWSVAISRFNHNFILDGVNKQIVVCDENGKIIQIITLPENVKYVWDIALMDDFVLVTLSLTSLDITRREDRDDRLVKYTLSGEYVKDVGGQTSVQTKFYWPFSVAVNSKNVIMVYDWGNECIKCFDSNLNFLHQFGQSQLQRPRTESLTVGSGYIAVDEDDNVYVCGYDRVDSTGEVIREWIVKYGCDGKWICDLLKGHVSLPEFIAVMGDKIGVVEYDIDQIKVFSK